MSLLATNPYFVAVEEGKNVTMVCAAISPIEACSFLIPGEMEIITLIENETRSDNFEYFGDGFVNGQCGISITSVKKENGGNATCIVDLNEHLKSIKEQIQITITKELPIGKLIVH